MFFSDFVNLFMLFFFIFGKFFKSCQSVLRFFSQLLQPAQFAKIDYGTGGAAKVLRNGAKKWLLKQALGQIFLPALKCIPWPKFNLPTPNLVHQADLLFLPHDNLPRGRKVFIYALTVVDVASRYREAEPLTSKNSDEVALRFRRFRPELLQVDPGSLLQ